MRLVANYILLVFEGEKTERLIFNSFTKYFLNESENTVIFSVYCCEIYSLFHKLSNDPFLELFYFLKEQPQNSDLLKDVTLSEVSETYLFFDYDGHAPAATDIKLKAMLEHFDEETENGKLYISYPMVEAIRHLSPDVKFENTIVNGKSVIKYKNIVHNEGVHYLRNLAELSFENWQYIIEEHCKKTNHLMCNTYELPTSYISQLQIFNAQKQKHIDVNEKVAVLSAFPTFIADYYGYAKLPDLLNKHPEK